MYASVNSISSIPSPVYQCKKAFRLNMAWNWSCTLRKIFWMAVVLAMKVAERVCPFGATLQREVLMLLGIHSTNDCECLLCAFNICSSTSLGETFPRKMADAVRYLPFLGSHAAIKFFPLNICWVSSITEGFL